MRGACLCALRVPNQVPRTRARFEVLLRAWTNLVYKIDKLEVGVRGEDRKVRG